MSVITCKLCGSVDVVDKVPPAMSGVSYLPSIPQVPQLLHIDVQVPKPGVVPGAHTRRTVDEVHLTLGRGPLLCVTIQYRLMMEPHESIKINGTSLYCYS